MCEFISYIEKGRGKNKKTYFLTGEQVFNSVRGTALQEYTKSKDDLTGHGAIRWFYELEGGTERECTDFSKPDNFPTEIVEAIKKGEMRGFPFPRGLLSTPLDADYTAKCDALVKEMWDLFAIQENRNQVWRD